MIWRVPTAAGPMVVREQIEPDDEPGLLELFAACDDWFEAVTGGPHGPGDVQSLFYALPEGAELDDKRLFTVRDGERIVGVIDAVLRYPEVNACAVGMFLIAPTHRGRGVGTAIAKALLEELREIGITRVTATEHEAWPAGSRFLSALGFTTGPSEATVRRAELHFTASA